MAHQTRKVQSHEIGLSAAAMELKLPYRSAFDLLCAGRLRGRRVGGRWFVSRESVRNAAKYLQRRRERRRGVRAR